MSGITALLQRDGDPADGAALRAMLDRLRHRGPDGAGRHVAGAVALGHRLLATTPEDVAQPIASPTGDRWIVADARLDNRDELIRARCGPPEGSDAALILGAYERWGEACPQHLTGDFAFALWDGPAGKLVCARDPLGVRPLYYQADAGAFRCASEMDALFADPRVPRRPSPDAVGLFLASRYLERDATLWDGVFALPPAHLLVVTPRSIRVEAYWRPRPVPAPSRAGDADHAERFQAVFSEAVRCRLRARKLVGAEVSGGLDSTSVACEAERLRRAGHAPGARAAWMRLAFSGLACDERRYSQAAADRWGMRLVTICPMSHPALGRPEAAYPDVYYDPTVRMFEPLLGEARARAIRVVLTGLGGDHLMQRTGAEASHHLRAGRPLSAAREAGVIGAPFSAGALRRLVSAGLRAWAPRAMLAGEAVRRSPCARFPWLAPRYAAAAFDAEERRDAEAIALHPDPLIRSLCRGLSHSPETTLVLAVNDRLAARFGVELRHPFFDVRVVETLLSLPCEQRFSLGFAKAVLRRAMRGTLPDLVRERRDPAVFDAYVGAGVFARHRPLLSSLLRGGRLEEEGYVDAAWVGRQLDAGTVAPALLRMAAMELWLRASLHAGFPKHEEVSNG